MAENPSSVARFVGQAMTAAGVLIVFLSGACTLYFVHDALKVRDNMTSFWIGAALTIGGISVTIGIACILAGRLISHRQKPRKPPEE